MTAGRSEATLSTSEASSSSGPSTPEFSTPFLSQYVPYLSSSSLSDAFVCCSPQVAVYDPVHANMGNTTFDPDVGIA